MRKKYTTFAIIALSVFVLAFAFVRNGNFLNDLLPESKASYGKKVKLSKNVRSKRRGDFIEVETDDMKTVKMNESYQNDGVEYRVLSAVSSKKLVNIERTDRKYYYDEKISMDANNNLVGDDSYVTLEILAKNKKNRDYTFHLPSAQLRVKGGKDTIEDYEAMLMNPFDEMGHLKLEHGKERKFYIAFVVKDTELKDYHDRLCLLIDGKGQLIGDSKHLTEVDLRIDKVKG